jgi:uroporphyrinogen-III decarboxylase
MNKNFSNPINTQTYDFVAHNADVLQVWEAYRSGKPLRAPMLLSGNSRIWVLDEQLNRQGITWQEFVSDPNTMLHCQLQFRHYWAHHIIQDAEMGIPSVSWKVFVEFHNVVEEAWFGCKVIYPPGQVSVSQPAFSGALKEAIFERGIPSPFAGIYAQMKEFYEFLCEKAKTEVFYDRPVEVLQPAALATDGPFTIAMGIRGAEILTDILTDEPYYESVMTLITDAIIQRIRAWRIYLGSEPQPCSGYFADDAIQFLSASLYREKVLPFHKRLLQELYGSGPHAIHLCGNVQRHLPTIVQELNVRSIDTGFPIHWETLREEVGETVEILGGVPVTDLVNRTPEEIYTITKTILTSGILTGGKFILKEANNLPPGTPVANIAAMYACVKGWGKTME